MLSASDHWRNIDEWVALMNGSITDVPENGQSGWIAFYAAIANLSNTGARLTKSVMTAASSRKTEVLNILMANLEDDVQAGTISLQSECSAIPDGKTLPNNERELQRVLMMHYELQRQTRVNAEVSRENRVRPTYIQAMAIYIREPIFVLDVIEDGLSRVQLYTYHDVILPD
jgi:hypothetical protein